MSHPRLTRGIVLLLGAAAFAACTEQMPVSPQSVEDPLPVSLARTTPGTYTIDFYRNGPTGLEKVTSLPVQSNEMIMGGFITDAAGAPAQAGTVTFQYCSLRGVPRNDLTRADEAPLQACLDGTGRWVSFVPSMPVDATGNAYLVFGTVQIPRTIGFRCKFSGKGTTISGDTCVPKDFTWTP